MRWKFAGACYHADLPNQISSNPIKQCNSVPVLVFDQILTNQSVEDTDHCSAIARFTVSNPRLFKLFTLRRSFWSLQLNSICSRFLLLGLSHPLDNEARSTPDEDVLLLGGCVHDGGHQQLSERLPRLDQQVVRPAKESMTWIGKGSTCSSCWHNCAGFSK